MQRIFIVTPCLNAARYIDDTILSVITQSGDFSVHYHIQDGGSTDGTLEKIGLWVERLQDSRWPKFCGHMTFSFHSSPDSGLYDAVNRGFDACAGDSADGGMMSWINAGDRLEQGALQAVTTIRRTFPQLDWFAGGFAQINDEGSPIACFTGGTVFSRKAIAAGLYEGRLLGFLQQEGSFWSQDLWYKIGGRINTALKLAGDFDLWRQFAAHTHCARVNTITGYFRRHANGLSMDREGYYREVDTIMNADGGKLRSDVLNELNEIIKRQDTQALVNAGFAGPVVTWNVDAGRWEWSAEPIKPQRAEVRNA